MKKLKYIWLCLLAATLVFSCTRQDEYLKYVPEDDETSVGRPELAVFLGGNERVLLNGRLSSDPKVKKVGVFWEGNDEGYFFDVDISENRVIEQIIPIAEGTYNFKVYTFDADGNRSIAMDATGVVYGPNYISGLFNRIVKSYSLNEDGNVTIEWNSNPEGVVGTAVRYYREGETEQQVVPIGIEAEITTVLENPLIEEPDSERPFIKFSVLSHYLPELAFEEFSPAEASEFTVNVPPAGPVDITSLYIQNAGPSIEGDERDMNNDGGKWGVPKYWNVTQNVRNQRNDEVGGWKSDNGGIVHFESRNWDGPGFQNGKVWQSPTIPAGTYSFTVNYQNGDGDPGKEMYIAAAIGENLPDIGNMASSALAYKEIVSGQTGEHTIYFTLTESRQVSLGLVITLGGNNNGSNHWLQFNYFKMKEVPTKEITSQHMVNAGAPGVAIEGDEINGNWGVPKNWNITQNVRNQAGNTVGGWKNDPFGKFHFESQDWGGPGYENGKVWQNPTLPAGTYELTIFYERGNTSDGQTIDLVAATGGELPNRDALGSALASKRLSRNEQGREHSIFFTLSQPGQVSMGLLITLGGSEEYLQFQYFKLKSVPTP